MPSPRGKYIGVLALAEPMKEGGMPSLTLEVYDLRGRCVARIPRAQRFAFAPDDRKVAVIVGDPYEGGLGFKPEKVVLAHLPYGKTEVVEGLADARKLAWIRRPKGAFLFVEVNREDTTIVRYDLRSKTISNTELMGLECSPDAKYYWLTPLDSDRADLCDPSRKGERCIRAFTWKNEPIPLPRDARLDRGLVWASPRGHEMVFMTGAGESREAARVDLATGTVRAVEGRVDPSWTTRKGWMVMWGEDPKRRLRRLR